MSSHAHVFFGTRIPMDLKKKVSHFCQSHGIKINYLITQAIQEKLGHLAEDEADIALAKERLALADFVSQEEMDAYFHKRHLRR